MKAGDLAPPLPSQPRGRLEEEEEKKNPKLVHAIYRVNFGDRFNLHQMKHLGRLYTYKPFMLKVKGEKSTLLLFESGKGILHSSPNIPKQMLEYVVAKTSGGSGIPAKETRVWKQKSKKKSAKRYTTNDISLVCVTFVYDFGRKFKLRDVYAANSDKVCCSYEPEIFCALVINPGVGRAKANLFHTGKLVSMGCANETKYLIQ